MLKCVVNGRNTQPNSSQVRNDIFDKKQLIIKLLDLKPVSALPNKKIFKRPKRI